MAALLLTAALAAAASSPISCSSTQTARDMLSGVDLSGRVILTTGADGHIASELNVALAAANASLVLACYSASKCNQTRQSILDQTSISGAQIETVALDLSSAASIRSAAERMLRALGAGGLHALVNAAGAYSTRMSHDGLVSVMEINLLGHALLTELLLPALRSQTPPARVVNVAAAVYGTALPPNTTAADLAALCTHVDPKLNATGGYFALSKLLLIHHALELSAREPTVGAYAVNPGYAVEFEVDGFHVPQWMLRLPLPSWLKARLPAQAAHIHDACTTNFAGLAACPETYAQAAAVLAVAATHPAASSSGTYLDFHTKALPPSAPQVFGPYAQTDPTCVARTPPPLDVRLRSTWFDEMLTLMNGTRAAARAAAH